MVDQQVHAAVHRRALSSNGPAWPGAFGPGLVLLFLVLFAGTASAQTNPLSLSPSSLPDAPLPDSRNLTTDSLTSDSLTASSDDKLLTGSVQQLLKGPNQWTSPSGLTSTLKVMLILTILSVAPALLLMTTSFIRVLVVLGLLRQALGTQQLPPSQVITSLALFITLLVMTPVWTSVYNDAIVPYRNNEIGWEEAWSRGKAPIVAFMGHQIETAKNTNDIWLLYDYFQEASGKTSDQLPDSYEEMPLQVLIPAYILSELKTAFLIGFNIYLPFLVLDIVIASVTISMGMLMLPPVMISLPFKIMLFVLVDGWHLVVSMRLNSCGADCCRLEPASAGFAIRVAGS